MKRLKKALTWTIIVVLTLHLALVISDKTYLYKAIANTYLKGRNGPSIDEFANFDYREVKAGVVQEWPIGRNYNQKDIPGNYLESFKSYGTIAYVIIKNDSIRYEQYWNGYGENAVTNSFSMAKTFVSVLVGIAIQEGKITSVEQRVSDFLPTFKKGDNAKLRIKDLLTMSSGMNFDEDYVNPFAYPAAAYYGNDLKKLTYQYKVTTEPGKVFEYLSGNTALLAFVLESATGKTLSDYASEKLWKPMGARNTAFWGLDHKDGTEKAYCCFNSNARDFARLGQLYLDSGQWKDNQLVPKEYVQESIKPANLVDDQGKKIDKYGYSWWLLNYQGHEIFYARGILGQYIFVIPDKNMVIIRLGHKRDKNTEQDHPKDAFVYLGAALDMY